MTGSKVAIWGWIAVVLNYCGLQQEAMIIYSMFILFDFITWVIAAYYVNPSEVTSQKWIKWLVKKISLLLIPFIAALFVKGTWYDPTTILTTTLSILIAAEAYSILWNIYTIQTGQKVKENEAVKTLLEKLMWITKKQ